MFARNSDLYFELSASCSARSSRPARASSISRFLISMSRFCRSSSAAFSWSSSFVCWSSSCCCWSSSSDAFSDCACSSSSAFDCFSSSWRDWSSSDWLCSSCVSDCDCCSSSSVRRFAISVFSTTPIVSMSCSRNVRWISLNGSNDASSITPSTWSSNRTGRTMMFTGAPSPRPDVIFT